MITSVADERISSVRTTDDELVVALADGRTLAMPLDWYPRLLHASPEQRNDWLLLGGGYAVHWPQIDEDLSVQGFLRGVPAPGAHIQSSSPEEASIAEAIQAQIVDSARDFYGHSLSQALDQLHESRYQLQDLLELLPESQEDARAQIQELVASYEAMENALSEAAQDQGVQYTVREVVGQVEEVMHNPSQESIHSEFLGSGPSIYQQTLQSNVQVAQQGAEAANQAAQETTDAVDQASMSATSDR